MEGQGQGRAASRQLHALHRCRKEIVSDLDVQDVLPEMLSKLAISHRDKQLIDHENSLEDKADRLLQILEEKVTSEPGSNGDVIPTFIQALKRKYDWIYQRLSEDVPDSHSRVIPLPVSARWSPSPARNKILDNILLEESVFDLGTPNTKEERCRKMLESGGVQCLPPFAVERKDLLEQIRSALENLKSNRYVVLQGMAGSGKSVLAIQAIHDFDLLEKYFPSGVFWLPIGKECSESKDALLAKMRILCDKLGESRAPNSFDHGADLLRTAILKRTNTLLILDDVWRSEVVRAFDVGCRILITTRDLSVMDVVNGRYTHLKVGDGFTEEESLSLFSQALNIPSPNELPAQARLIHAECKGSPMVVGLLASLMQEHPFQDLGRWQYYLDSLVKRKYSKVGRLRGYEHGSIVDAISLSFEGLSEQSQRLYCDFALFQDDVGIPCSVLMILWNLQKYEVEDIMKEFVRKSLVIEEYDPQKKVYIYSIHDLLLDYLKTRLVGDLEIESHKKLVDQYLDACRGEYHKLPDDNYIFFYLGYHLYKSKMYHYFQKIYFDMQFIGEKLRITGPADLLVDIRKYLDFIVGADEERLKNIEEIQTFAQLVGHRIYGQIDVDVIQIALQTPHLTWIHSQARHLAQLSTSRLYLEWRNAGQWKNPESTVLCSDHVYCVKFVGSRGGNFIAGLSNGCIQLCDLDSSAVCHVFFGHSDSVQSLKVFPPCTSTTSPSNGHSSPDGTLRVLSASADKTCKLWNLKPVLEDVESKPYELKTGRLIGTSPSPKLRPDQWAFDHQRDDSYLTFELHTAPVSYAEFSDDGSFIVSTSNNEIMIWKSANGQIFSKISPALDAFPDITFQRCLFPPQYNARYLLACAENQLVLISSERSSIYTAVEAHPSTIVDILYLSPTTFCSVSENEVGLWRVNRMAPNFKSKASRSRSLSPSRCLQFFQTKTEVDSKVVLRPCKTLDPNDIHVNWKTNGAGDLLDTGQSEGHSVVKSSSASNAIGNGCFTTNPSTSALIDTGSDVIEILKEEVLPNRSSGILLCAATAKSEDERGRLLACGTSDHKILLWRIDSKDRTYLGSFTSHNGWVTCLDFSSVDVCTILSGSEDHTVMVWDIQEEEKGTKEPQKNVRFSSSYVSIGFGEGGFFLSAFFTEKNTVQIYKDAKRVCESSTLDSRITALNISDCARFLAIGTDDGKIYQMLLEDVGFSDGKKSLGHMHPTFLDSLESRVCALDYGFWGKYLVAGSADGSFMVLEGSTVLQKFLISRNSYLKTFFVFSKFVVAVAQDSSSMMINLDKKDDIRTWKGDNAQIHVTCCICSLDASLLAFGTSSNGVFFLTLSENGAIVESKLNAQSSSPVRSIALDKACTKMAIGYDNGLISIWIIGGDMPSKEMELVLHKSWVRHMIFSPEKIGNSHWLISCGDNLAVWNLDKEEIKPRRRSSFMSERRKRRSGDSPTRNPNRLSLEIPDGSKIGRQGKRELLQQFAFRGNYAQHFVTDLDFSKIITVDDTGIFYLLETLQSQPSRGPSSAKV